jgi:sugar/nucleoside kinase (ribokinase family)
MRDLVVLGDFNPDLLLSGGDIVPTFGQREQLVEHAELTIGGSATIMACGAARLGVATAIVGAHGDDDLGRLMRTWVAERGVDASHCPTDPSWTTGITLALARGDDRAILTMPGAIARLRAAHVDPDLVRGARHLHVGSYYLLDDLRPDLPALVDLAKRAGATVSVDPQEDPSGGWDSGLRALLPRLDILFVNEEEERGLRPRGCPLVVVKRGPRGAVARTADGDVEVEAPRVEVVDATGAGDSFDAGFVTARLSGAPVEEALRLACACGALAATRLGGTAGQPTLDEARQLL